MFPPPSEMLKATLALAPLSAGFPRLDLHHRAVSVDLLLDDLHGAGELHRHRAHPHHDLRLDRVRARPLDDPAPLDARHESLEVEDRVPGLVDGLPGREWMVELNQVVCSSMFVDLVSRGCRSRPTDRLGPAQRHPDRRDQAEGRGGQGRPRPRHRGHAREAELDVAKDPAVTLRADGGSPRVREGSGGVTTLGDEEKAGIEQTIDDEVLKGAAIEFRRAPRVGPRQLTCNRPWELELAGRAARSPLRAEIRGRAPDRAGDGQAERLGHQAVHGSLRDAQGRRRGRDRHRRQALVPVDCLSIEPRLDPGGRAPVPCAYRARSAIVWDSGGSPAVANAPAAHLRLSGSAPSAAPRAAAPSRESSRWRSRPRPRSLRRARVGRGPLRSGRCRPARPSRRAAAPRSPPPAARSGPLPSGSVVRLSTILPVGCTRRNTARYASSATYQPPESCSSIDEPVQVFEPLPLLVGGQRVVLLQVAEARPRPAERMRRNRGTLAARIDAGHARLLTRRHRAPSRVSSCLGSVRSRSASPPSCLAPGWRWPTAPPRRPRAGAGGPQSSAAIACATSSSASRLWPLTSASQYGSAAAIPPARGEKPLAATLGLTHTIWCARREALHLAADERGIALPPAIGQDHHHRAASHPRRPWRC